MRFLEYIQENLLLDEDSNIKLIDFGLVAEPEVSHNDDGALVTYYLLIFVHKDTNELLQTCCGSPAYAAPGMCHYLL